MVVKKAGTILLNKDTKQIALVYRKEDNGYTFPKGHLELGETIEECAVRETEEETLNSNYLLIKKPVGIVKYQNTDDGDVEVYYYISLSDGKTTKEILEKDREICKWINFEDVESKLAYDNLKELWNNTKSLVKRILENDCKIDNVNLSKID